MPYALHQAGLFAGLALMAIVAVITDYSLVIMVRAGHLAGTFTYQVVLELQHENNIKEHNLIVLSIFCV